MTDAASCVSDVFPLRLSDFEYYMLADDRPSHPMVIVMLVEVSGQLLEREFRDSVRDLIRSQPLLSSRVEKHGGDWFWVEAPDQDAGKLIEWQQVSADDVLQFTPQVRCIDLRQSVGICAEVRASAERSRVAVHLHHACCDGIGAVQIVGELFARYGQRTSAANARMPEFVVPDRAALRLRDQFDAITTSTNHRRSPGRTVAKIARLLLRSPVTLTGSVAPVVESGHVAIHRHVLPRSRHRALRAVAASLQVSLNDLLIREMLQLIRDWNAADGRASGRDWIRLGIPLSMRAPVHEHVPACNIVSYALVTRRMRDCDDPAALLASIHDQTGDVLFHREGIVCLKLFKWLRRVPGAMSLFLKGKSCLSTLVLANVGDLRRRFNGRFPLQQGKWVAGNVVIEHIHGVAPVRPRTHASVSIGDYAGELSVSIRTDPEAFDRAASVRFLTEFVARLNRLAAPRHDDANPPDDAALERLQDSGAGLMGATCET